MKRLAALFLAGCSASTVPLDPLAWQKVQGSGAGGAILDGHGAAGAFDERANFTTSAIKDGDTYRVYYGGSDANQKGSCGGINGTNWRIGLATSTDGVNFTRVAGDKTGGSIVDLGVKDSFDETLAYRPVVLKDGNVYRLWYNGATHL